MAGSLKAALVDASPVRGREDPAGGAVTAKIEGHAGEATIGPAMALWVIIVGIAATVTLVVLVRDRDWKTLGQAALCLVILAAMVAPAVWAYS